MIKGWLVPVLLLVSAVPGFGQGDGRPNIVLIIADDPGEMVNLAGTESEKFDEMIELWRTERKKLGIVLPGDL